MSELYLILHKVRGEPAFDIAQKIVIGEEEGWIIPTSGHRAYPFYEVPLAHCTFVGKPMTFDSFGEIPPDLPDHYDAKRDETQYADQARRILFNKGVIKRPTTKPAQPTYRRI